MNLATRIVLGAALGAILVLILHPLSRPYFAAAWQYGDSKVLQTTPLLPENVRELPPPTNSAETAYWIQVSADYDRVKRQLASQTLEQLLLVVQQAREDDPQNAFWHQIESVYLLRMGRASEAEQSWFAASRCLRWNDLQFDRLAVIAEGMEEETRGEAGWYWGYLYERRSTDASLMISRHAIELLKRSVGQTSDLKLRVATIRNGALMRDGCRFNAIGLQGAGIIERATYPVKLVEEKSQRVLLAARLDLLNKLRAENMAPDAEKVESIFRGNESWLALANSEANQEETRNLQLLSLVCAVVPGVALLVSLVGVVIALLGRWMEHSSLIQRAFTPRVAPYFGAGLAVAIYLFSRLWLVALLVVLCLGFFAFSPDRSSKEIPKDLGPMFRFTLVVFGLTFAGILFLFFAGLGPPGLRLGPAVGLQRDFGAGSPQLLGIAGVVICLVLMTAPTWGMARQLWAPRIAGLAVREFGLGVFAFFLLIAILSGPAAVILDAQTKISLNQIVQNEPTYYLVR